MDHRQRGLVQEDMRSLENLMDTAAIIAGEPDISRAG